MTLKCVPSALRSARARQWERVKNEVENAEEEKNRSYSVQQWEAATQKIKSNKGKIGRERRKRKKKNIFLKMCAMKQQFLRCWCILWHKWNTSESIKSDWDQSNGKLLRTHTVCMFPHSPKGRYNLLHLRMELFLLTTSLLTLENYPFEGSD